MKKSTTPTFLLELPLAMSPGQAKRQQAHFEAARCLYNALLGEALARLHRMWADPAQAGRRVRFQRRRSENGRLRSLNSGGHMASQNMLYATTPKRLINCAWIADHIDAMLAQTLATRAYQAVNRVCLGKAKTEADARKKRRLERKLDRKLRTNNPQHYDKKGRIKKHGKRRLTWKNSKGYLATRRRLAHQERKLAAHRKSLHGRLVNEMIRTGNDIRIDKVAYKGWQKQYGKSDCLNAACEGQILRRPRRHHRRQSASAQKS